MSTRFTQPYSFRILARLPNDTPVELMRSRLNYSPSYLNSCRLPRPWKNWVEHVMSDRATITARPGSGRISQPISHEAQ